MPENTAVPPCPKARRDRMSNAAAHESKRSVLLACRTGWGGKIHTSSAARPDSLSPPARQHRAGSSVAGVCQWLQGHCVGFDLYVKFETFQLQKLRLGEGSDACIHCRA